MTLVEEAKGCSGCLDWHKHCRAECCKMLRFYNAELPKVGKLLRMMRPQNPEMQAYLKLRGANYQHGWITVPVKDCVQMGDDVIYAKRCKWLTPDNLCQGHPNEKPEICKRLTLETAGDPGMVITPNCLFKYKKPELLQIKVSKTEKALYEVLAEDI